MTTRNELLGEQIAHFSEELNIDELSRYAVSVKKSTDEIVKYYLKIVFVKITL